MTSDTFNNTISVLKKLPKVIVSVSQSQAYITANALKNELRKNSPVDSGEFSSSWNVTRGNKKNGVVASYSVQNNVIQALSIEYGSVKGRRPWPSATNIKTVEVNGRIFSTQAVGGVFKKVNLKSFANSLAKNINSGISMALR